jgi:hypothetical protein
VEEGEDGRRVWRGSRGENGASVRLSTSHGDIQLREETP